MFQNILIIVSEKNTEDHINLIRRVRNDLKRYNTLTVNVKYIDKKDFDNIDLVLTIGGDGTFIRASHFINNIIPILGINSVPNQSEGALLIRYEELEKILADNLNGKTKYNYRNRIQTIRNGALLELALNEIYLGTEKQFTTSRYIINYRDNSEEHRSSGVLIATSSGSHSWYKSAGGIPFENDTKLKFLVREPYFGKVYNPKILNGEILLDEKIIFYSRRFDGGIIAIDSYKEYPFNFGDTVEIKMSNISLKIVSP